jgi:phosphate transport system ATP-binding protein
MMASSTKQPRPATERPLPSGMFVRDLFVSYGAQQVLKGINVVFRPGLVTAIIGPSGCGKSTLLRTLNRLTDMTERCKVDGEVYLDRTNVLELDPQVLRRQVGMVFQRPNPFPMTVRENVLYGVKATRLKVDHDQTVRDSLVGAAIWDELKSRLNDSALALSLGQQQRLCIARLLAVSPTVILLDEPAASLDPASTAKLEDTIARIRGDYTVVIVTHNLQQAWRVSDYTVFLNQGRVIEHGPTAELFDHPRDELTKQYVTGRFN